MTADDASRRAELIALLEERQDEETYEAAKSAVEAELARGETAALLRDYGYVHECRGAAEIREATRLYRRSLELDPAADNPVREQLILAHARLLETNGAIELYKARVAADPENVVEYRHLAQAYLMGGAHEEAGQVVAAGLALDRQDPWLLEAQGAVQEGQGRSEEALATWLAVFELDPDRSISPRYSRVFLLERLGLLPEAAAEWEAIVAWLEERGHAIQSEWPKRELARLRAELARSRQ